MTASMRPSTLVPDSGLRSCVRRLAIGSKNSSVYSRTPRHMPLSPAKAAEFFCAPYTLYMVGIKIASHADRNRSDSTVSGARVIKSRKAHVNHAVSIVSPTGTCRKVTTRLEEGVLDCG